MAAFCGVLSEWRARSELVVRVSQQGRKSYLFSSCHALPGPKENRGLS